MTPSCSFDNDSIASAEDDDRLTTVCGREEPIEGCQLTYLRKTYSDDQADRKITQELIDHFTRNPSSLNLDKDLHKSARSYTSKTRYVQRKFFVRKLANEESVTRDWLVYSPSTRNVYCYVCKLFRSGSDSFSLNDFND